jgi:multiple antibiotic resistance protein
LIRERPLLAVRVGPSSPPGFPRVFRTVTYYFVALFVITDPFGVAAIFIGLTRGATDAFRRQVATRAVAIAGVLLLVFAFGGDFILKALGVGLPAFQIAGGTLLFLLAIDMLMAGQAGFRDLTRGESIETEGRPDISVFPLAIPLIAGPGAMTTMVLLMSRADDDPAKQMLLILVLVAVLAITWLSLYAAGRLVQALGTTGVNVISRVLGVLLAALAVQLILDGISTEFRLPISP